jgi:hypothetical protein
MADKTQHYTQEVWDSLPESTQLDLTSTLEASGIKLVIDQPKESVELVDDITTFLVQNSVKTRNKFQVAGLLEGKPVELAGSNGLLINAIHLDKDQAATLKGFTKDGKAAFKVVVTAVSLVEAITGSKS